MRFAVLSDTHLSPPGTPDGRWNNVTRLSVTRELLAVAAGEIARAGHDRVLMLGDIADRGASEMIGRAVEILAEAGTKAWVVPGNHDVSTSSDALARAVGDAEPPVVLRLEHLGEGAIALVGHDLISDDGGQTCRAIDLPDVRPLDEPLLVWATHYPVISRESRLVDAGLRYPGDLLNRADVETTVDAFHGPVLVLHGHLHCTVVGATGHILQIGFPAVAEWPHAWTDVAIEVGEEIVRVRTTMQLIPGGWSSPGVDVVLDSREQDWTYADGGWGPTQPL